LFQSRLHGGYPREDGPDQRTIARLWQPSWLFPRIHLLGCAMKKADHLHDAEIALAARSRHQAEAERKNVSPERLAATVNVFIEWRSFAYWVRLVADKEGSASARVQRALEDRCPGFLEQLASYQQSHSDEKAFLWLQLIEWIDAHIFSDARSEAWQHALGYYAARDDRLDRIRKHWLKCDEQWATQRPPPIVPEYCEWRLAASESG
jgi:hypothetical protein